MKFGLLQLSVVGGRCVRRGVGLHPVVDGLQTVLLDRCPTRSVRLCLKKDDESARLVEVLGEAFQCV